MQLKRPRVFDTHDVEASGLVKILPIKTSREDAHRMDFLVGLKGC